MNIVVLMKEVPDTSAQVVVNDSGDGIQNEGLEMVINPYDEYAIEEALKIKADKGGEVVLLTAGPDSVKKTVRKGLAMGADRAIHISDDAVASADALGLAKMLAKAVEGAAADLVLCGREAVDHGRASVGAAVAEYLGWPQATDVVKCDASADGKLTVEAERDGGHAVLEVTLPALLTTQKGLNEPRYASLKGIMKAKKKKIEAKSLSDLGLTADDVAPRTKIVALEVPAATEKSLRLFDGDDAATQAQAAVQALTEELKIV